MVREAERMVALDTRLPALLRGEDQAADAAESADFARLCHIKQLYATAARLWEEAFATRHGLADDIWAEHRYHAARSAALAGCGLGQDDPPPDAAAGERWRRQARDWLRADLVAYARLREGGTPRDRAGLPSRLGRWRVDPALAGLRDEAALSALPDPERRACRALWSEVEALHEQVKESAWASDPVSLLGLATWYRLPRAPGIPRPAPLVPGTEGAGRPEPPLGSQLATMTPGPCSEATGNPSDEF
jgi:hypothetical protein